MASEAREPLAGVSREPENEPKKRNKYVVAAAAGVLATALVAGAGAAVGARMSNGSPEAMPGSQPAVEGPAFSYEDSIDHNEGEGVVSRTDSEFDPNAPVIEDVDPNPLGLKDLSHEQIMSFGSPVELLAGSKEDAEKEGFEKDILDRLSKSMMRWANETDPNARSFYEGIVFAEPYRVTEVPVQESLFADNRMDYYFAAKEHLAESYSPEESRALTMETGFDLHAVGYNGRPNMHNNIPFTKHVIRADVDFQAGTRPQGTELNEQAVGVDYQMISIKNMEIQLNEVTYTDPSTGREVTKDFWQIGLIKPENVER